MTLCGDRWICITPGNTPFAQVDRRRGGRPSMLPDLAGVPCAIVKEAERSVMRTLGLLGGMSWESTAEYYRLINRGVAERLGGRHSARLLMYSIDFADLDVLQRAGDWWAAGAMLGDAARGLERIGAEAIVLAANTMHEVATDIESAIDIPLIHIVDPTGEALARQGIRRAGLLGTRYTMELPFWRERMRERYSIEILVPGEADRALVHRVIFDELSQGRIDAGSRAEYVTVTERLRAAGADAVIFGCTEIGLLLRPDDVALPAFDTTALHAAAAVSFSLAEVPGESRQSFL